MDDRVQHPDWQNDSTSVQNNCPSAATDAMQAPLTLFIMSNPIDNRNSHHADEICLISSPTQPKGSVFVDVIPSQEDGGAFNLYEYKNISRNTVGLYIRRRSLNRTFRRLKIVVTFHDFSPESTPLLIERFIIDTGRADIYLGDLERHKYILDRIFFTGNYRLLIEEPLRTPLATSLQSQSINGGIDTGAALEDEETKSTWMATLKEMIDAKFATTYDMSLQHIN
ncbi:hypothetical protein BDN70DRAFT_945140 [Pholiota conissans]|uniref:Uncharacterized protein n=1 Tax=Pholiota conissans TaxID=109636 RepID=A0A9P5YYB8_9AGAR|nr:hypothetical protein BDN70DRAFT_945140 [Pholiota conissans]